MQESRYDGQEVLTGKVRPEQIQRAIADPRNKSVTIHKPGSMVHLGNERYIVQFDGSWKLMRPEESAKFDLMQELKKRLEDVDVLRGESPQEPGRAE